MRPLLIGLVIAVGFAQVPGRAQTPAAPKVQLTFEEGGIVTLVAAGATVREIFAEWTRKGGTPFVGAERLTGGPLTLQFEHRPETEVVASLLRNAAGYVLGPRREGSVGASALEVVFVLATSTPTAGGYTAPAPTYRQPQISTPGSPGDEIPPVLPGRGGQFPEPGTPPPPAPRPSGVGGVAVQVVPVTIPTPTPTPPAAAGPGRGGGGSGGR